MTEPLRAIIYSRVSTESQRDNTSHETQYEAGARWAQQNGAMIVRYYRDNQSGAALLSRVELQKALVDLENDVADVIVFYDPSRFSRDALHQQQIRARIEAAGKRMAFCNLTLAYDDDGEMSGGSELALGVSNVFSANERREIRKRTMSGHKRRVAEGKQPASKDPFGLHILSRADVHRGTCTEAERGTYVIVEAEAAIVRDIFTLYTEGQTLEAIARRLNARGTLTRQDKLWRVTGVRDILRNPAYKGEAEYGRTRRITDESRLTRGYKTKTVQVPRPPHEIKTLPCPALVDEATWDAANARLTAARARKGGRKDRAFMLSGLLRCPLCGGKMAGTTQKQPDPNSPTPPRRYYTCRRSRGAGGPGVPRDEYCTLGMLKAAEVEREVTAELFRLMSDEALLQETLRAQQVAPHRAEQAGEVEALRARLREIEAREIATAQAQIKAVGAGADSEVYETMLGEIAAQKRELRAALAEIGPLAKKRTATPGRALALHEVLEPLRALLSSESVTPGEKHDALTDILERVELRPGAAPLLTFVD